MSLYNKGKYKDAIKVFARCDSIDALTLPAESSRAWYGKVWMGACYHKLGDDAKAKELSPYYTAPPVDRRLTVQSDSLSDLVMPMYQEGKATEFAPILKRVMELERENLGENSVWCANTMMLYANALAHSTGDFNEGRTYVDKALAVFKVYRMHDSYIQANDLLYGWYLDTGDYATAKTILTVSRDLRVANNYPELEIAVDNATIAECDVFTGKPREGLDSIAAIAARCVDQLDMGKEFVSLRTVDIRHGLGQLCPGQPARGLRQGDGSKAHTGKQRRQLFVRTFPERPVHGTVGIEPKEGQRHRTDKANQGQLPQL